MTQLKEVIHLYVGCDVIIDGKERGMLAGGDFIPNSVNQIYYDIALEGEDSDIYIPYNDDYDAILRVKPILRNLSDITENEMVEIFKKISLFDLSECQFEYGVGDKEGRWVNAIMGGSVIDCIEYDGHLFYTMNNDGTFDPINPQWEVTVILLKMGFDLFNLIYRDLAIDSTTIKPATDE